MANEQNKIWQQTITLPAMPRGFHSIDKNIHESMTILPPTTTGVVHLFLQHTSASLVITENCCNDVKNDLDNFFNQLAPDSLSNYQHNMEGPDDMPAHIKSAILGVSLTIPVINNQLALGRWQGVYLGEHRNNAGPRKIILTVIL